MRLSRDEFTNLALQELDAVDRVASSLARHRADADDLVQETYLRALKAQATFKLQEYGIRPWLLRILHNTHLNRARRERRAPLALEPQVLEATEHQQAQSIPQLSPFDGEFQDEDLNRALDELPEDLRTILLLWAIDELSYKEMSHVLEIPIGTVMSRIYRARQKLHELLPHAAGAERAMTE
jgi:RNA polymerase sigma-70 factor (ECF subfamily)